MKSFRKDNGITLIALVVTIVVLLILAGITISTLFGENGIISAARRSEEATKQDENTTNEGLQNLENDMNKVINGGLNASAIAADPTKYYGKEVKNYVAGNQGAETGKTVGTDIKWKILYADDSHIYLIASDYVPRIALPYSTDSSGNITEHKPLDGSSARDAKFGDFDQNNGVMQDYAGSARIAGNLKYLNKSYFDFSTATSISTNNNMKAVAYMMDTKAWEGYKDNSGKADFVIGGPTIEILINSYNQKYGDIKDNKAKFQAKATSTNGYEISNNYGADDSWDTSISSFFATTDSLYIITNQSNAYNYWVASPGSNADNVMHVGFNGNVTSFGSYSATPIGFRPLVSLKSSVVLEEQEDGSLNIK